MKWTILAAALIVAAAPSIGSAKDEQDITLRGCVVQGVDRDTFVLTNLTEVLKDGASAMPATAHGRRVIFWLDKDDDLKEHVGQMVEVKGEVKGVEESEIELKAGHQKDGGLIVEFEGPGKDVRVSNDVIGDAIGTSGRTEPEKNDIKTFLIKVDVDDVKRVEGGGCSR